MKDIKLNLNSRKINEKSYYIDLHVLNLSDKIKSCIINIQGSYHSSNNNLKKLYIEDLKPGEELVISNEYAFKCGGCHTFYTWIEGAMLGTLLSHHIYIAGGGYYSGDIHSHSVYSDGKDTLEENRASMIEKGHSFLYSTDHNTLDHKREVENYKDDNFLHLATYEYTSDYAHALAYGSEEIYDSKKITGINKLDEWQDYVDYFKDSYSVYLAHPYDEPRFEFGDEVLKNIRGHMGIEVWNGLADHALAYPNRKSFLLWDSMNLRGQEKYYGSAVSDAHSADKCGDPYIKGYLESLSKNDVHKLLSTGKYFGSNGPEIYFTINDKTMGETVYITKEKDYGIVNLSIFDPLGEIESINLYKGKIGQDDVFLKVLDFYPLGESDKRLFNFQGHIAIEKNEIYRVEVISKIGISSLRKNSNKFDKGFAYTNPIWIE